MRQTDLTRSDPSTTNQIHSSGTMRDDAWTGGKETPPPGSWDATHTIPKKSKQLTNENE